MKNFDFSRFVRITRWDLINNWRKTRNRFIGFILGFICLQYFFMVLPYENIEFPEDMCDPFAPSSLVVATLVFRLLMLFAAANIISTMQTKQQRISTLMLPGTNLEKFISRLFLASVGVFLMASVAYCIADVVRCLWVAMTGKGLPGLSIGVFFKLIFFPNAVHFHLPASIAGTGMALFVHGCFCVGGIIFRRNSFIWSALTAFGAVFIASSMINNIDFGIAAFLGKCFSNWPTALAIFAIGLVPYFVAYWLYCQLQVINNKFFNL